MDGKVFGRLMHYQTHTEEADKVYEQSVRTIKGEFAR